MPQQQQIFNQPQVPDGSNGVASPGGQVVNNQISQQVAKPGGGDGDDDAIMDEDIACNTIPMTNFKSNNIQKREKFIQPVGMMSPGGI